MRVLDEQTTYVDGRAYTVRIVETAHHLIASVLEGPRALLELRVSEQARHDGRFHGKLKGTSAAVSQELSRMMQSLLVQELTAPDAASRR